MMVIAPGLSLIGFVRVHVILENLYTSANILYLRFRVYTYSCPEDASVFRC